jgi:hypothetical protein
MFKVWLDCDYICGPDVLGLTGPRGRPGKPGTHGTPGIPGINAWQVKVNGTISNELLIPPTIAGEYVQITCNTHSAGRTSFRLFAVKGGSRKEFI